MRLVNKMNNEKFDFGSLVDAQMKGIRRNYKFGKAFNDDKLIVRPKKAAAVEVGSADNATIKAAWETNEPIAGLVEKEVKGGYEVTICAQRTFCPFSQIDKFKKDASEYIGRKLELLVTEYSVDDRGLSVVVSRRALIEKKEAQLREETLAELSEGEKTAAAHPSNAPAFAGTSQNAREALAEALPIPSLSIRSTLPSALVVTERDRSGAEKKNGALSNSHLMRGTGKSLLGNMNRECAAWNLPT